jgi:hypothetical protein
MRDYEEFKPFDEGMEKPEWHFTYSNNDLPEHPVVFECDADDILKADDMFELELGIKPEKTNHIGCSVIKN